MPTAAARASGMFLPHAGESKGWRHRRSRLRHYRRWPEDVEWLQRAGFSAYRFSTAWPRIIRPVPAPSKRAGWISTIAWSMVYWRAALRRGFVSIIGTCRRRCRTRAAGFSATSPKNLPIMRASSPGGLADRVRHWAMFNEANVHALFGHGIGNHAPGWLACPTCWPRSITRTGARPRAAGAAGGAFATPPRHRDQRATGAAIVGSR